MIRIPAPRRHGDAYRMVLDGETWSLAWRWADRTGRWWLRLATETGDLVAYLPVTAESPLLLALTTTMRPAGDIIVLDETSQGRDPGLADQASFGWYYLEATDLAEALT